MVKKTEYLVTQYLPNGEVKRELRAPKGVNPKLLVERLICSELEDELIIASCLRANAKRAYDPFRVVDMREDHRRDNAHAALSSDPDTEDPIGVYNRARGASIPLGQPLIVAGVNHDYFVKEVEVA